MKYLLLSLCVVAFWIGGSRCGGSKGSLSITFPENTVTGTEGDKMKITCMFSGNPLPEQVTWQRMVNGEETFQDVTEGNNYQVMPFERVKEDPETRGFSLSIMELAFGMSGDKYKCLPSLDDLENVTVDSHTVEIVVEEKKLVHFSLSQEPDPVEMGEVVQVTCKATTQERKELDFSWVDENESNLITVPNATVANRLGTSTLTVRESDLEGSKVVYCRVEFKVDGRTHIETASRTVKVVASLNIDFSDRVTATEGEEMKITCTISGSPLPEEVTWQHKAKDGDTFESVKGEIYEKTSTTTVVKDETVRIFGLIIQKVTLNMNGDKYKCTPKDVKYALKKKPPVVDIVVNEKQIVHFSLSQEPDPVVMGEVVHVTCNATTQEGKELDFSWVDEQGKNLIAVSNATVTTRLGISTLTVRESDLEESKVVYCKVEVDGKDQPETASSRVNVAASLSIKYSDSVTGTEGAKMNVTCVFSGKPLPNEVIWQLAKGEDEFKDVTGNNYKPMPFGDVEGEPKGVFILTIENLTVAMDGDKFKCAPPQDPAYKLPEDSPASTEGLVVKEKEPQTSESPTDDTPPTVTLNVTLANDNVAAIEGNSATITCRATGKLKLEVTWQLDASGDGKFINITKGDVYNMTSATVGKGETKTKVFNLTIKTVTKAMSGGQYKCKPQDVTYNDPPPVATLTVEDKVTLKVMLDSGSITATEGVSVSITCRATGKPVLKGVTWQLDVGGDKGFTDIAKDDGKYAMTSDTEKSLFSVTIKEVTKEMNGNKYKCNPPQNVDYNNPPVATLTVEYGSGASKLTAFAVAVVLLMVLCGAVSVIYWKRHTLRNWLMDQDVVKVIKKQKRAKGYKYSKLPRDITTSMKHLE